MDRSQLGVVMLCGMCLVPFVSGFFMAWTIQNKRLGGITFKVEKDQRSLLDRLPAGIRIWINEWLLK